MTTLDIFRNSDDFVSHDAGSIVFREGEAGDCVYVVKEGEVEIRIGDEPLFVVEAGGIFGEMALIEDRPRSASAVCRTAAKLVVLDRRRFLFMVQQTPFFALHIMQVMAERLRRMDARV